jgi:serine-threonine kinase receptor-associated protein
VFFVSACLDKLPMIRDAKTGDWVGTFEGHKGAVWAAKLNADASKVATGSADFTARLWDATNGESLHTWEHRHIVKTVDMDARARRLATGGKEKLVRIFDLERPDADAITYEQPDAIRKVLWDPEQNCVAVGLENGSLRLVDTRDGGKAAREVSLGAAVMDIEYGKEGVLTVAAGKSVRMLSAGTWETQATHTVEFEVECASLRPDGKSLVMGGSDLWVHQLGVGGEEMHVHKGHHGPVHCVRYAPDGLTYASGSDDATVRIWPHVEG